MDGGRREGVVEGSRGRERGGCVEGGWMTQGGREEGGRGFKGKAPPPPVPTRTLASATLTNAESFTLRFSQVAPPPRRWFMRLFVTCWGGGGSGGHVGASRVGRGQTVTTLFPPSSNMKAKLYS